MIWVALAGQFDNVGDTLHRKVLLEFLRPLGRLHLHIGAAPATFLSGLGLDGSETLYSSSREWVTSAYRGATNGSLFVFSSGEVNLARSRAMREFALSAVTKRVRDRGGKVVRIGVAAGNGWKFQGQLSEAILRSAVGKSTILAWRERRSQDLFGVGSLIPDLGFGVQGDGLVDDRAERDKLALTMRFDRPLPDVSWVQGVKDFSNSQGLGIVVTSQVRRDNDRSQALADALGGRFDPWVETRSHEDQEAHVRRLYSESALVASDRLHALIAGATEGAAVAGLATISSEKIPVHFAPVGISVSNPKVHASANEISSHLEVALNSRMKQNRAVREAYSSLVRSVDTLLSS